MEESKNVTICGDCVKSSTAGNKCKHEDTNQMSWCPCFMKSKPRR